MKTTILGLLAAAAAAIQGIVQQGHSVDDWKTWVLPVALAILGYLAKDATTGPPPGLLLLFGVLFLPGCAGLEIVTHTPYGSGSYRDGVLTAKPTVPIVVPIRNPYSGQAINYAK